MPDDETMARTTYRVRSSDGTYQTTDAEQAEKESDNGAVVSAVTHA